MNLMILVTPSHFPLSYQHLCLSLCVCPFSLCSRPLVGITGLKSAPF
jgi:hypothetical protein